METGNNIYDELAEISPLLASLERVNPYSIPDNFFESFADQILNTSISESYNSLAKIGEPKKELPAGYFDNFAENILAKIKSDLAEDSTILDKIGRRNIFSVPTDYFETLPGELLAEINSMNLVKLAGNDNVFAVPDGYFDTLNDVILSEISTSELSKKAGKSNVFSIPSGYFENLPIQISAKVKGERNAGKVVQMKPRVFSLAKLAVAASITLVLSVSAWFMLNNGDGNQVDKSILADAKEINQTNSFDQVLNSLTDEEITVFLEDKGENVKAALVASAAANNTDLPTVEEYIFDENTLNEFLKENAVIN